MSPDDQDLIDRAVRGSGLNRTDFVLKAARTAAKVLLVEPAWQTVSAEQMEQFHSLPDTPPAPNELLRRNKEAPSPWQLTTTAPAATVARQAATAGSRSGP